MTPSLPAPLRPRGHIVVRGTESETERGRETETRTENTKRTTETIQEIKILQTTPTLTDTRPTITVVTEIMTEIRTVTETETATEEVVGGQSEIATTPLPATPITMTTLATVRVEVAETIITVAVAALPRAREREKGGADTTLEDIGGVAVDVDATGGTLPVEEDIVSEICCIRTLVVWLELEWRLSYLGLGRMCEAGACAIAISGKKAFK